jgi:hypothetical protein
MSYFSEIDFDNALKDKFGNLNVSSPYTLFTSKMLNDNLPLVWHDSQVSGGGTTSTFNTNQSSVTLSVSALTAGKRVRQTFRRFSYEAGKSQRIITSFLLGTGVAGVKKKVGYFDDKNGLFLQLNGIALQFVRRTYTSGVALDSEILQSNWNVDPLDGSGPSGKTIDVTKTQLMFIEFGWLGVDGFIFGFYIDGQKIICHQYNSANSETLVFISNPNLPLRVEIENDGTGGATSLLQICSAVQSSSGSEQLGFNVPVERGSTSLVTNNDSNIYCLAAFRFRSGYEGYLVQINNISLICTSTAAFRWVILLNPTVTGTALSFSTLTNTPLEIDVARTNATTLSGGRVLDFGVGIQNSEGVGDKLTKSEYALGSNIAGTSDIVCLGIQRLTGTSETFYGGINLNIKQ